MKKLIYLGTSAGGMRPKAVIAYNLETEEFRSGQVDLPKNFKQYIIKFKEADDSPTTEIEMVYSEMAKAAGINMMPCFRCGASAHGSAASRDQDGGLTHGR